MNPAYRRPFLLAGFICAALMAASLYARPLFPVDETRYLTVAWEMHQSGNFILPTLNHEAYHHKPPVLFWLINLMWTIFGISQGAAMVVPYLAAFGLLAGTARLARRLFPAQPSAPLIATALLGGSLPFVIYANLIMFDLMLGVSAVLCITAVYDYMTTRANRHLVLLAIAAGIGGLIKGPVILLHFGTVLLLARFWMGRTEKPLRGTILPVIGAVICAVLLALCWAIPAAIEGGKAFADKIFWGQTAGRVVNAFDHQRPFFWYLIFVPLFTLPWLASPALWRGLKTFIAKVRSGTLDPALGRTYKFLLSWGVPVFLAFCFISGKQVHYLLPLLPCLALWFTGLFLSGEARIFKRRDALSLVLPILILTFIPVLMRLFAADIGRIANGSIHIEDVFTRTPILPSLMATMLIVPLLVWSAVKKQLIPALIAGSITMTVMMASFQLASKDTLFANYDLTPVATLLTSIEAQQKEKALPPRPVAFVRTYHGEFGFMARLDVPVQQIMPKDLSDWFAHHPDGVAIMRSKDASEYAACTTIFSMPYKLSGSYALLEKCPATTKGE